MDLKSQISADLQLPVGFVEDAIENSRKLVRVFSIQKRDGTQRKIYHPSKKLKTIQYWLINSIFNEMPVHEAAMAYREGISILDNAQAHRINRFFLKMDLKDFFPSITFSDLLPHIQKWHKSNAPSWLLDREAEDLIRKACFYLDDQLMIGYPSSPVISNVVMNDFDQAVVGLISSGGFGTVVYTRYADDLIFSTCKAGATKALITEVEKLVAKNLSPRIQVNHQKTMLGSSKGGSASVTGLKICANGHITLHRKQKDHIRLLLSLYKKGTLDPEEKESLIGHISFCKYYVPDFYTKLADKYFDVIANLTP